MANYLSRQHVSSLLLSLAGPAAVGLAFGLPAGVATMGRQVLSVPAVVVGTSLFMLPALYIASSLAGIAPCASHVASSWLSAQRDTGVLLLGLAPAALFIFSTTRSVELVVLLCLLAIGLSSAVGIRSLFLLLFANAPRARALPVFSLWALVAVGLGSHLTLRCLSN